jgi:hypothetical protein
MFQFLDQLKDEIRSVEEALITCQHHIQAYTHEESLLYQEVEKIQVRYFWIAASHLHYLTPFPHNIE